MLNEYLSKPNYYLKNFEVGGKYNMLEKLQTKTNCDTCKLAKLPIQIVNWKIKNSVWWNFDGKFDFFIVNWELKFWKGHSFISEWKNVEYAWELFFDKSWNLNWFSKGSWHYQPLLEDKYIIINFMKEKYNFDISRLKFTDKTNFFKT